MSTSAPPPPFGAGPPLRTPAFELTIFGQKILLYWERPWLTWLNGIQTQANQTSDIALIGVLADASFDSAAQDAEDAQVLASQTAERSETEPQELTIAEEGRSEKADALASYLIERRDSNFERELLALLLINEKASGNTQLIFDTHANRGNYPAAQYYPALYFETDANSTLIYRSTGTAWAYAGGMNRGTLASLPATLGADDSGYIYEVTDYWHLLRWNGANWIWGPGDVGSGYYQLFEAAPSTPAANAWQICDGSTVARLNSDGTTTNVTLDDLTTPAYLKGATASAVVAAASGATTSVSAGTPSGTNSNPNTGNDTDAGFMAAADLITGTNVALNPHVHTTTAPVFTGNALAGHSHGPSTIELRNATKRLYYRR